MNKNWKKLLCALAAVLLLAGCRSGGGETSAPAQTRPPETTAPSATLPEGEGVEEWDEPAQTDPVQTTAPGETVQPTEDSGKDPTVETTAPSADPTVPVGSTDPTEPAPTNPQTQPTEPSGPQQTTPPQTGTTDPASLSYAEYLAMTPAQQQAHYEQFASLEAYIAWHNAALAEYEENQSSIEVTGPFDIGDFMGP